MTKAELEQLVEEQKAAIAELQKQLCQTNDMVLGHIDYEKAMELVETGIQSAKNWALHEGALYRLPYYTVGKNGLESMPEVYQMLPFVKGVTNNNDWHKQDGIILEDLYAMLIVHTEKLHKEVPSEYSQEVLKALKRISVCLKLRRFDREKAGTLGTDKK